MEDMAGRGRQWRHRNKKPEEGGKGGELIDERKGRAEEGRKLSTDVGMEEKDGGKVTCIGLEGGRRENI